MSRKTRQPAPREPDMVSGVHPQHCVHTGKDMKAPEQLNFLRPEWHTWRRRWERYRTGTFLDRMPEGYQVNQLLYYLGSDAEELFDRFNLSKNDAESYEVVIEKFEEYFEGQKNLVFERSKFFKRRQDKGEPIEKFLAELHGMSRQCEFGKLRESLVMHKIIEGMTDVSLSERLQIKSDLTLGRVESEVRQAEKVRQQQPVVRSTGTGNAVSKVTESNTSGDTDGDRRGRDIKCKQCGYLKHGIGKVCPALKSSCHKCGRRGHFASVCRQAGQTEAAGFTESGSLDEDVNLGLVSESKEKGNVGNVTAFNVLIDLNGLEAIFRIDTGADVTLISERLFKQVSPAPKLKKSDKFLSGPGGHPIPLAGMFRASLTYKNQRISQDVYVTSKDQTPLLGQPAILELRLLKLVGGIDRSDYVKEFPDLFDGIGTMKTSPYHISLVDESKPHAVRAPRRIPVHLKAATKMELDRLESLGVINRVEDPTDWVASMVVVPKPGSSDVRICVDYYHLNKAVKRERSLMPSVDELLAQLEGAAYFSKLDCNSGYFQLPLAEDSKLLTTFITPFGRYYFNRLPMGITSAPEVFHKRTSNALKGIPGVVILLDDFLVFGRTKEEHDERVRCVLNRLREVGITLNKKKCEFGVQEVKFLGHMVGKNGISVDPEKVSAIVNMPSPKNLTEVRRFLGMCNYYVKFLPKLSEVTEPIRMLLKKNREWMWDQVHESCVTQVKNMLISAPVLTFFDMSRPKRIAADASSVGLGAVMEQMESDNIWKPVFFASRSLTESEKRYSNIEREGLGIVWACEKFKEFLIGDTFTIQTDHRPLLALFGKTPLEDLTPRLQRMRMRMARFSYNLEHVAGKEFYTPDALSRSVAPGESEDLDLEEDIAVFVNQVYTPRVKDPLVKKLKMAQEEDAAIVEVVRLVSEGWTRHVREEAHQYKRFQDSLYVHDGLLLFKGRIVVPVKLRREIMDKIHEGHAGERKCLSLARVSVWWPGISREIRDKIAACPRCVENRKQSPEPLLPSEIPKRPWEILAVDYFKSGGSWYIVVADYFSKFLDVRKLNSLATKGTITYFKHLFSLFGIPVQIRCDNGTNLVSYEMIQFAEDMGFEIVPSSPKYPQSNGFAEAMVKIGKRIVSEGDLDFGLLAYRTTPLDHDKSPAELLMGRRIRNRLPTPESKLTPDWTYMKRIKEEEKKKKEEMKTRFDRRHRVKELRPLREGERVWIIDKRMYGTIARKSDGGPRRYVVKLEGGGYLERNRRALVLAKRPT